MPLPASFVVKYASKIRARTTGDMPMPVSDTVSATYRPGRMPSSMAVDSSTITSVVSTVRRPPFGMASRAFTARFITTCSICPASTWTNG